MPIFKPINWLEKMNDEENRYLKGMLENDHSIVKEIYQNFFPMIRKMVTSNSGTVQDAYDVFQEGLIVIFKKVQQPGFKLTCKFSSFLYPVCWNKWLKVITKKGLDMVTNPPEDVYITNEDLINEALEAERLYKLYKEKLALLSEKCQQIIQLYVNKVSGKEIAKIMNYDNENVVRQKYFKCKDRLIKLIRGDARYEI